MTDAKLSKELALALGCLAVDMQDEGVLVAVKNTLYGPVRLFDYRDPTVCLPLIKWLMRDFGGFFTRDVIGPHQVWYLPRCFPSMPDRSYSTLEEAVARAVIAVRKGE